MKKQLKIPSREIVLLQYTEGSLDFVAELLRLASDYCRRNGMTDARLRNSEDGYEIVAQWKWNTDTSSPQEAG